MNTSSRITLHPYQTAIIKRLTLGPPSGLSFNECLLADITSDHTNYHLKQLVRLGLVTKNEARYLLTDPGKDYAGSLDDAMRHLEKPPKTSVIIWAVRKNSDGVNEYLVNRRLRHPYFGKVGRLTGKVRFGESLQESALRELYEETGLTARFVQLDQVYRKVRRRQSGEVVQDNVFFIFFMTEFEGDMVTKTEFQENFWITVDDVIQKRYHFYDDFMIDDRDKPHKVLKYTESIALAEGF